MPDQFSRTELLIGTQAQARLAAARVAVFGIGGVGGYTVEVLARSGIGELDLIDDDRICLTNLNRQILATYQTIGQYKTDVAAERIHAINPKAVVHTYQTFFLPENADIFPFSSYDYIVDAVDTISAKIALAEIAAKQSIPIISVMGAGNKMDPSAFEVADIYATSVCPLARVMRRELKKREISSLKVVYSREKPIKPLPDGEFSCREHCICPPGTARTCSIRRQIPGSNAFVPAAAGLIAGGEVVKDLINQKMQIYDADTACITGESSSEEI